MTIGNVIFYQSKIVWLTIAISSFQPHALTTKSAFVSWQKHLLEALLRRYGTKICEREKTYVGPMKLKNRTTFKSVLYIINNYSQDQDTWASVTVIMVSGLRPRWITPSEICLKLHILQKPNSLIANTPLRKWVIAWDQTKRARVYGIVWGTRNKHGGKQSKM